MPPPIPLSAAGSWNRSGSQPSAASSSANRGRIRPHASAGDAAAATTSRTSATKLATSGESTRSSCCMRSLVTICAQAACAPGAARGRFRSMPLRTAFLVGLLAIAGATATLGSADAPGYAWHETPTGSAARLRGVSAVSAEVAWTSGSLGTVLRTVDAGTTWQQVSPPGTETLQFRDIEAFDADHAV